MKKLFVLLFIVSFMAFKANAIEGMWLPVLIQNNIAEMQSMGLNLEAADLYNEDGTSIKDAIVRFGRGCTAAFISPDGLIITNHHCGYGAIQSHSSVENDYLKHGFWAENPGMELPNKDLTITLLKRMEDVTQRVLSAINDGMDEETRQREIRNIIKTITDEASHNGRYHAQVSPFYYGNEYYLFVSEVYKDVRLVGAPPSAIGKFGGDVDNWMWPRHSGDFALFRVYADENNSPVDYNEANKPYTPAHFLPVSNKGIELHDFTLIYGFPGRTNQYLTSHEVDYIVEKQNPAAINIRTSILKAFDNEMGKSDLVRIQYSSKHARVSNAWKRWIGESRGLKNMNAVDIKQQLEDDFIQWASSENKESYSGLITAFDKLYQEYLPYSFATTLYNEAGRGSEIIRFAQSFKNLVDLSKESEPQTQKIDEELDRLKTLAVAFFKDYHIPVDKKVLEVLTKHYIELSDPGFLPEGLRQVDARFGDNIEGFTENIFSRSFLVSERETMNFLENYKLKDYKALEKDVAYNYAVQLLDFYRQQVMPHERALATTRDSLYREFTAGLREMMPHNNFFPDANGTLRIAYGRVEGSNPRDAVVFDYYTTADGILEKAANTEVEDYTIPERLNNLLEERLYGDFASNDQLVVNFIASNHTTGGNSGSPVLGANGEFVGINFDRSWESTMSDIMFDPDQCRNIAINSQYILWVISQYAQMNYLLEEMIILN